MRIRITWQIAHYTQGYLKFKAKREKMYGALPTRRAKKKLKSIWYYLINDNEKEARICYKQLNKELERDSQPGEVKSTPVG